MSNLLSSLAGNLAEGLYNNKCQDYKSYLEHIKVKDKCVECNKNHKKYFNEDLIKKFPNTYKFCNGKINKFCLMLRKSVYPYKYMDSCKKFNGTSLLDKKEFCSSLNIENIRDADYSTLKNMAKL